jgi:Tol biopolymer transport system component/DNA-binding winged helix-turn-helix (wHTH) protein
MSTAADSVVYEFGPFRLRVAERVVLREGAPIPLAPKVVDTLLALIERAGHVVSKEELMTRVWPDTFVEESNLAQNVFRLRKALGGASEQAFIETVPRRGYRFAHPVRRSGAEEAVVPPLENRRRLALPAAAAAALVLIAAVFGLAVNRARAVAPAPAPRLPLLEKLTTDSRAWDPAISADGRFVAYAVLDGESKSIWLKNLGGGSAVQVMPPSTHDYRGLRFSPDGTQLFYKTFRPGAGAGFIERVPLFGGAPQEVASGVWNDFAVSPDGRQVAFVRGSPNPYEHVLLVVAAVDGSGERVVARSTPDQNWFDLWDSAPSWSADGKHLALCGGAHAPSGDRDVIFDIRLDDGAMSELPTPRWSSIEQVAWLGDGSGMLVVARDGASKPAQIWMLDVPGGSARRVTNDLNEYNKLGVTPDSRLLVVEQQTSFNHVWVVPDGDTARAKQLTFGAMDSDGLYGLSWTPGGRILFVSNRTGEYEIWSMNADGSDSRQLTARSTGWNYSPRATRDGRYVVFASDRSGKAQIWRMDAGGANPVQLTTGLSHVQPEVSADGRWVYCTNADAAPSAIERVSIDGGEPQRVSDAHSASIPAISPDGTLLAFNRYDEKGSRTALMPAGGGKVRTLDIGGERGVARWSADGRTLIYVKPATVANLWMQPVGGGAPRPLTHFDQQHIWNFAVAPDGKNLALSRGSSLNDVVLLSRFR